MAIADPARCNDDCDDLANTRLRLHGPKSLAPKSRILAAVASAMALAACARNPAQRDLNPVQRVVRTAQVCSLARPRVYIEGRRHTGPRVRRPDSALLEPQLAPSCEFNRADIKAVDPDEWARLKAEFERQCYRDAEKAARERLSKLQAAVR